MTYQVKVVATARATVAGLVDERAGNMDTEPPDRTLFTGCAQIRRAESERIEGRPIVDETYLETSRPPSERHGDASTGRTQSVTMRYGVSEEFVENDQKS
jgi:hypothetical protein